MDSECMSFTPRITKKQQEKKEKKKKKKEGERGWKGKGGWGEDNKLKLIEVT